jgi:hypothetical protein
MPPDHAIALDRLILMADPLAGAETRGSGRFCYCRRCHTSLRLRVRVDRRAEPGENDRRHVTGDQPAGHVGSSRAGAVNTRCRADIGTAFDRRSSHDVHAATPASATGDDEGGGGEASARRSHDCATARGGWSQGLRELRGAQRRLSTRCRPIRRGRSRERIEQTGHDLHRQRRCLRRECVPRR